MSGIVYSGRAGGLGNIDANDPLLPYGSFREWRTVVPREADDYAC